MHRKPVVDKIKLYSKAYPEDSEISERLLSFVEGAEDCFERSNSTGHITGSCILLSPAKDKILLTHHKKLNKWLQLGGHSDGDPDSLAVAVREAQEESGIEDVVPLNEEIFSVDIHEIPARKNEPTHLHYDINYLIVARNEEYKISDESNALKWFSIPELLEMDLEPSLSKMILRLSEMDIKKDHCL